MVKYHHLSSSFCIPWYLRHKTRWPKSVVVRSHSENTSLKNMKHPRHNSLLGKTWTAIYVFLFLTQGDTNKQNILSLVVLAMPLPNSRMRDASRKDGPDESLAAYRMTILSNLSTQILVPKFGIGPSEVRAVCNPKLKSHRRRTFIDVIEYFCCML